MGKISPLRLALALVGAAITVGVLGVDALSAGNTGVGVYTILTSLTGLAIVAHAQSLDPRVRTLTALASALRARTHDLAVLGGILLQLLILLLVIREFRIESPKFHEVLALFTVGGFVVHALTPRAHRLRLFLLLSFGALYLTFGLVDTAWIALLGGGLVGICHLPIAFWGRILLILSVGLGLTVLRAGKLWEGPWSSGIWPILGSMFMFRLAIYLYDLRHDQVRGSLSQRLSYFFLLPNASFPLFPVVDYGTYRRTYYDTDEKTIYQDGVKWIFWGVVCLLAYRVLYQNYTLQPEQVATGGDLLQYVLVGYLLMLRVMGQFHLIVGILHLFGFHLPSPFHLLYLASSFTDVWRRANTYWKDFMMKCFYNPVYYSFPRWSPTTRLVGTMVLVFVATWALHAWQWFWILGSVQLSWPDGLYWALMGLLVLGTALWEAKRGRTRTLKARKWSLRNGLPKAAGIASTFALMCILFSLWNARSLGEWLALWSVPGVSPLGVLGVGAALFGIALVVDWIFTAGPTLKLPRLAPSPLPALLPRYAVLAPLLFLLVAGSPSVSGRFDPETGGAIQRFRTAELNRNDAAQMVQGYYENLFSAARLNSQLWEVNLRQPTAEPSLWDIGGGRRRNDFLKQELLPSARVEFHGAEFTTNRWAMRDREYEQARPDDVYRIALVGSSISMGWGVADDEVFEHLVEERLNREPLDRRYTRYEVLNFAIAGNTPSQSLLLLNKVLSFDPQVVLCIGHEVDSERMAYLLASARRAGTSIPFDTLRVLADRAVTQSSTTEAAVRHLMTHEKEIWGWSYGEIARRTREAEVLPLWAFVPRLEVSGLKRDGSDYTTAATAAGFIAFDLSAAYSGIDPRRMILSERDRHPNAEGHRRLADELYQALRERRDLLFGPRPAAIRTESGLGPVPDGPDAG